MGRKLKIGVIGAGRIAQLHIENLVHRIPEAEVAGIADIDFKRAKELAVKYEIDNAYEDYKSLLSDPNVDAVFVCSTTDTHSPVSIDAARANKHIFCEKPIDRDLERIKTVLKEVEKSGVKYQVAFNRRFDNSYMHVKDIVKEGKVGDVHIVKITARDPKLAPLSYLKDSGGLFLDMSTHDFDMVRYLSGCEIVEVAAMGACLIDKAVEGVGDIDTAITTMRLSNGALAVIDNSRQAVYGYDQRIEVFGSKGCVCADNATGDTTSTYTAESVTRNKPLWDFLERFNDAYIEEARCFIDSCLNEADIKANAFDGLQSIRVALAAAESWRLGGVPVKVEE
ncbi:inositol 2-dehydrogenase [Clostridium sp. AF15-17LB]|nr:inositol 2-dehydrogenase [Clostridium sp. AF15-17LB]